MPIAVELGFDEASTQRIRRLWVSLASIYGGPKLTELGVDPHVSLTIIDADQPPPMLHAEIQRIVGAFGCFRLTLDNVGSFPTSEGVVYLAPQLSSALTAIHRALHQALAEHHIVSNAYYLPGAWVPHCTVASEVGKPMLQRVMQACRDSDALGDVLIQSIAVVSYRPATLLYRHALRSTF